MKRAEERHEEGKSAEVYRTSENEILYEIDREARRRLGMSGEEFAVVYWKGLLPDTLAVNELAILLDSVRGGFVRASRPGVRRRTEQAPDADDHLPASGVRSWETGT